MIILYLRISLKHFSGLLSFNMGLRNWFGEVVVLLDICLLKVRGKISCRMLSPATTYAAYFVFKMKKRKYYGFHLDPVEAMLRVVGDECLVRIFVWTLTWIIAHLGCTSFYHGQSNQNMSEFEQPNWRSDGWFEIELGEFQTNGKEMMKLRSFLGRTIVVLSRNGLVVVGIDIRPKTSPT